MREGGWSSLPGCIMDLTLWFVSESEEVQCAGQAEKVRGQRNALHVHDLLMTALVSGWGPCLQHAMMPGEHRPFWHPHHSRTTTPPPAYTPATISALKWSGSCSGSEDSTGKGSYKNFL